MTSANFKVFKECFLYDCVWPSMVAVLDWTAFFFFLPICILSLSLGLSKC